MSVLDDMLHIKSKFDELDARDSVRKSTAYFECLAVPHCPVCKHQPMYREGPPETLVMCDHFIAEMKRKCSDHVCRTGGVDDSKLVWCGFAVERPSD